MPAARLEMKTLGYDGDDACFIDRVIYSRLFRCGEAAAADAASRRICC